MPWVRERASTARPPTPLDDLSAYSRELADLDRRLTRRGALAAGAGLAVSAAGARAQGSAAGAESLDSPGGLDPWPLPAHDLRATRAGGPIGLLPGPLAVRWSVPLTGGAPASAAIVGDRAYAASTAGSVAALSLADGSQQWRRELGTATYGSGEQTFEFGFLTGVAVAPARVRGVTRLSVFVASDRVFCLDAAGGATRWQSTPLRTPDSDDYHWGHPVVVGNLVLVGSGSGSQLPIARGKLTAYRLADGTIEWSRPTVPGGGNGGSVFGPPTVDQSAGIVYIATGSPYQAVPGPNPGTCSLIALRQRDGSVLWSDQVLTGDTFNLDLFSPPVIVGRLLVVSGKDGFRAWDRVRRTRLWHVQLTDPLPDGATEATDTAGPLGGPIATDGQYAYVLSNDGETFTCVAAALELSSGRIAWRTELPGPVFAAPALAGGRAFCAAQVDGTLAVIDARDGRIAATASLGEQSAAAPVTSRERIVVGTGAQPFLPGESVVCLG
jgi:outer membrane protein assembly factor BamB